jgi:hypothetical protein
MKTSTAIIAAAAAGGVLYYFMRQAHAREQSGGAFGELTPEGGSSMVAGRRTGKIYPVGIGATGEGGTLYSVFSPNDPSVLLFVFLDGPSATGAEVQRVIVRRNSETDAAAVDEGLNDFDFPVQR